MKKLILSLAFVTVAVSLQAGEGKKADKASCCAKTEATACCAGKSAASCGGTKVVMSPKGAEQTRKS